MKFQKSLSFLCYLFVSSILVTTGCSKPILKMPKFLSPTIKEYKHITLHAGVAGMRNTGIYLNEGEPYSILATGSIDFWPQGAPPLYKYHDVRPEDGWPLMARVGDRIYFCPLSKNINSFTGVRYDSGYLYLGYKEGEVDSHGEPSRPDWYSDDTGSFSVDIIVWKKEDWFQVADFFEKMKEKDPTNKAIIDAHEQASRWKEMYVAKAKTSKEIEETKKELQELKKIQELKEAPKEQIAQTKISEAEVTKQEKIDQLETKLIKLTETLAQLEEMKKQLEEERKRSRVLSEKLVTTVKEKEVLKIKLESESDIKSQLRATLQEREDALKRKDNLVASLYEKERQLKSKLFQLEETSKKSKASQDTLEGLKIKAEELKKEIRQREDQKLTDTHILKSELDSILIEKSKLEIEANSLRNKEIKLKDEVNSLRTFAEKTRTEAEDAKKQLATMRERETELIRQVDSLKKRLDRGMAPVLVISRPKNGTTTQSPVTVLNVIIVDDKGIENLSITLNGKQIKLGTERGVEISAIGKRGISKKMNIAERLPLEHGENRILVSAKDTDGMTAEEMVTVTREKEHGKIWAIVIGINRYQNTRKLKYAVNDARAFRNYLKEHIGIPEENIFFLTNQRATKAVIQSLLGTQIKRKASKEDTVIIFYAGHGAVETDPLNPDGDGFEKYLLPYDANLDDLYSTAIAMKEIKTIFYRIRAERLIFIADTCYSGASGGRTMLASKTRATLSEKFFERISKGKGRVIISACSANEISKEDDRLEHGVFTYYLLKGLKGGADFDGDGIITVSEIFGFLSKKVPEASGQDQHPVRKGETEGELVIGRVK